MKDIASLTMNLPRLVLAALALLLACALPALAQIVDGKFPVVSNLKAGVASVDITPASAAGITVVGHRREVVGLLHVAGAQQGEAGLPAGHHVGVIPEDRQRVGMAGGPAGRRGSVEASQRRAVRRSRLRAVQ